VATSFVRTLDERSIRLSCVAASRTALDVPVVMCRFPLANGPSLRFLERFCRPAFFVARCMTEPRVEAMTFYGSRRFVQTRF